MKINLVQFTAKQSSIFSLTQSINIFHAGCAKKLIAKWQKVTFQLYMISHIWKIELLAVECDCDWLSNFLSGQSRAVTFQYMFYFWLIPPRRQVLMALMITPQLKVSPNNTLRPNYIPSSDNLKKQSGWKTVLYSHLFTAKWWWALNMFHVTVTTARVLWTLFR